MNKVIKKANKIIGKIVNTVVSATSQTTGDESEKFEISSEISELCRKAGAEGIVMLKNSRNVLPIKENEVVSVFGRVQNDFFYVGYGSGGDVNAPYKVGFMEGLKNSGIKINEKLADEYKKLCSENPVDDGYWGHWPMSYDEIEISNEMCIEAAKSSDKAIIILGRSSGEDRELKLEKGSYLLSDEEKKLIGRVTSNFKDVILLLNCGSIMDFSEISAYDNISSILYVWQAGMESGNAIADVLSGKISPCGKLTDTIAKSYNDYPGSDNFGDRKENHYTEDIYVGYRYFETFAKDKVIYPFGYGLSYTEFKIDNINFAFDEKVNISTDINNVGEYSGKEVIQVYFEAPQGKLGKPSRVLVTFKKTNEIKPGEKENISLSFPVKEMASYSEELSAFILEKGTYNIYLGTDVRSASKCGEIEIKEDIITEQLEQFGAPHKSFMRLENIGGKPKYKEVPLSKRDLRETILNNIPKGIKPTGDKGYKLIDVKNGKISLDDFVAQLSYDDLEALSRGDFIMSSPLGPTGNAGVFGGTTKSLEEKGVPPITTTDGPSGIRLKATSSLLPIGVSLASTWNTELIERLYEEIGKEMKARGSDVLLAPGMNIHRNPLCGRNFEYFSEDPVVTGKCGAAVVKGVQKYGLSACPKHFACNNQETNRTFADSIVSERALREIYLLGFEICVKTANPLNLMTSYNRINGVWGHYQYELVMGILKKEWGYKGNVMTDWWMRNKTSPEFPGAKNQAYRVRAGVNVLMPGGTRVGRHRTKSDGTLLSAIGMKEGISLAEVQNNAKTVLSMAINKLQ